MFSGALCQPVERIELDILLARLRYLCNHKFWEVCAVPQGETGRIVENGNR